MVAIGSLKYLKLKVRQHGGNDQSHQGLRYISLPLILVTSMRGKTALRD
jgi:hypothetical protein